MSIDNAAVVGQQGICEADLYYAVITTVSGLPAQPSTECVPGELAETSRQGKMLRIPQTT